MEGLEEGTKGSIMSYNKQKNRRSYAKTVPYSMSDLIKITPTRVRPINTGPRVTEQETIEYVVSYINKCSSNVIGTKRFYTFSQIAIYYIMNGDYIMYRLPQNVWDQVMLKCNVSVEKTSVTLYEGMCDQLSPTKKDDLDSETIVSKILKNQNPSV